VLEEFRHQIIEHHVETSRYEGLAPLSNGALMAAMAGRFDVLVTVDASIAYQQDVAAHPIAVIVLRAGRNTTRDLMPLVPRLLLELAQIGMATIKEIR
jgi:hypothetical protein